MHDVVILVERHECGWTATAIDEVGTILARTAPTRLDAVELCKAATREELPEEAIEFTERDLAAGG